MKRWIVRSVGGAVALVALVAAVFVAGMRTRNPAVVDRVRRFNRAVTNPRVLRSAGRPGASASVIRHVGRVSGRAYETPVGPFPVGDAFVIALPYGPGADWVRNVMANGSAVLLHEGRTVAVHEPHVVSIDEVLTDLPSSQQRTLRLFGVHECLRLRPAPADPADVETSGVLVMRADAGRAGADRAVHGVRLACGTAAHREEPR